MALDLHHGLEHDSPRRDATRLRQATALRSMLPGPLGRMHELALSRVAAGGIRQAAAAAKPRLEAG